MNRRRDERKPRNAYGIEALECPGDQKRQYFPVFFPVNGKFSAETSSQQTASTAILI
jgi:hypothetical protein